HPFGGISALAFAPDGKTLASVAHDGYLRFWDPAGRRAQGKFLIGRPVLCLAYSPDGQLIATADKDGWVHTHRAHDGQYVVSGMPSPAGSVRNVAFSRDGSLLAACGDDAHVRLYSVRERRLLCHFHAHDGRVWSVVFAQNSNDFVTAGADRRVRLWQLR